MIDKLPRMLGTQAAGAAPLVSGQPVSNPETIATAIRIGSPASWGPAVAAQEQSNGRFLAATDDEILQNIVGLTPDDLLAAWDYYQDHRAEIDQDILENEED